MSKSKPTDVASLARKPLLTRPELALLLGVKVQAITNHRFQFPRVQVPVGRAIYRNPLLEEESK